MTRAPASELSQARDSGKNAAHRLRWLLLCLIAAGAAIRLYLAWNTFLNPDEALHYFVAAQPSWEEAYKASLTMAHPPLMILLLHGWAMLGSSEFFLRLPFVCASLLFSWVTFLLVEKLAGRRAAVFALALCLFLPSLIALAAEIRQYSPLLLFCAISLYAFESALDKNSALWMVASAGALALALLTHYSALIFALAAGIYGLVRLSQSNVSPRVKGFWVSGQAGALAICAALFKIQIAPLRRAGVPRAIASTWLSNSIFHAGQDHLLSFAINRTVRVFRYVFYHGTIGVLALLLFIGGIVILLRAGAKLRAIALLLALPFFVALATALAGVYPYGGTRHDALLAMFAIPAIALALDRLSVRGKRAYVCAALFTLGLLVCNLFPSPSGPYIHPHNQRKELMSQAVHHLHAQSEHSLLLTDHQAGLVLGYYLCGRQAPLMEGMPRNSWLLWNCGDRTILTALTWQFEVSEFPSDLQQAWKFGPSQNSFWLFRTGWIENQQQEWAAALRQSGCDNLREFGPNIQVCRINRP